jgi:Trypsin-co-occurring domain 2
MDDRIRGEPDNSWATLAQAIEGVRAELSEAMAAGEGGQLRFDVGEVELEFTVEFRRDLTAKAGVGVWVVELGGSGARSRGSTHRLKVTLNPVDIATGRSARVDDRVSGVPPRRNTG